MTKQEKAQQKRERRAVCGPGFASYAKRNTAEEAEGLRSKLSEWREKRREAVKLRAAAGEEKRAGVFERMFGG